MLPNDLRLADGAEVGEWIAPRLEGGFGGKVEQLVPNDYDGYVRVFHPATDAEGKPATWAQVADELGRTAHREMQWHRLMGVREPDSDYDAWPGSEPRTGELDEPTLRALCAILEAETADPRDCFFGLSTIYGGIESAYPDAVQLKWRSRDFIVFAGPLSAAGEVGYESSDYSAFEVIDGHWKRVPSTPRWFSQPPNLIWPADRSWFVQSEYDLDSTLVGGSRELVDSLMASSELETWDVERGDSLEAWADEIN